MVARLCGEMGLPHQILRSDAGIAGATGNVQELARILRYRLLAEWAAAGGIDQIAVAHHIDDVAESFLMRAVRGAGIRGLSRMPAIGPVPYAGRANLQLLRPLLGWRRAELAAIVSAAGLKAVDDPSNQDDRYDRVRMRKLLAAQPALDPEALARASSHLAEADAALAWAAAEAWASRVRTRPDGAITLDSVGLPREIQRRLATRSIEMLSPSWNGEGVNSIVDQLARGEVATLGGVRCAGGETWRFEVAPAHRSNR